MLNTRQTNRRKGGRWWTCQRCGNDYPEAKVVIQKGYVLCMGSDTNKCVDEYGYEYYREQLEVPYEEVPENPPTLPWEDI